jgi:hypothetical protein
MGSRIFLKLIYRDQVVSPWYSEDGKNWKKINVCADVQPYCLHAGIPGTVWIRPALFSFGKNSVTFKRFEVIPLDDS